MNLGIRRPLVYSSVALSYTAQVLDDGAVGFWEFAESSGTTAIDQTGNSNGIYQSNVGTLGETGIPGGGATALLLNYGSSVPPVTIPPVAIQNLGDIFTVELWLKVYSGFLADSTQEIWGPSTNVNNSIGIELDSTSGVLYPTMISSGVAYIGTGTSGIGDTTNFHHLVWTKHNSTNNFYLDGSNITPGSITNATISTYDGFGFGGTPSGGFNFGGTIAMFAIYPTALTSGQVSNHYTLGTA